ncbi:MAG: type IV toxin-antitoxin system AbiEi family antitoxin domain-containing protein [Nocardioides sp.]
MYLTLAAEISRHDDLVTARRCAELGIPRGLLARLVRSGHLVAVRRGVYTTRERWESATRPEERALLAARAASEAMVVPHLMSHDSAALELGMQVLLPRDPLVHVTRWGVLGSRTHHGVKHHKAPFRTDQVLFPGEGRRAVLDPARTAMDIARDRGLAAGVVAADSALRVGATTRDFQSALADMRCWPHVTVARETADLADAGAENVAESLGRILVSELGFGRPETQFGLRADGREAWCDLRIGRHVFEVDGRVKYVPATSGGVAAGPPEEVLWGEKQRQDFVCGFKLGMSRIVWADFWGSARRRARQRLRREYLDTLARFGSDIDDLAPYVIRGVRR